MNDRTQFVMLSDVRDGFRGSSWSGPITNHVSYADQGSPLIGETFVRFVSEGQTVFESINSTKKVDQVKFSFSVMEGEERPKKMPKLEHGCDDAPIESQVDQTLATGKTQETETDDAMMHAEIGTGPENSEAAQTKLSKNQLKKLKRREQWETGRVDRRVKRKEKQHVRKERKRAIKREQAKNMTEEEQMLARPNARKPKAVQLPLSIVVDCSYDDLMLDKERISLSSQITRIYSDNGKARLRAHIIVSSFNKLLKERFETRLNNHHLSWRDIQFIDEDFLEGAKLADQRMKKSSDGAEDIPAPFKDAKPEDGEVIYLSSDSSEVLTELKPYSTYVVGGLVDKNRHKGVCYKTAVEKGLRTAKLPIGDYMQMASRFVLTTNHVVDIMLRWLELRDWGKAFDEVLPKRKGAVLRESKTPEDANDNDNAMPDENENDVTVDDDSS